MMNACKECLMKFLSIFLTLFMVVSCAVSSLATTYASNLKNDIGDDYVSQWIEWAKTAWSYYDPGIGVDPKTGILRAGYRWPYLTDWDLGGYIVAVIKAELMGILPAEGEWGADDRIEKILKFLETRPLSPYGIPYRLYCATNGEPSGKDITNVSDAGRLLIALALLKRYRSDLAARIDAIVERNNYKSFVNDTAAWRTTAGFYKYYVAHGFKFFGLDNGYPIQQALKEFERITNGPHINVFGVDLPTTQVTSEPLLHAVFELNVSNDFMDYVKRVYLVQENRYYTSGKYTAWSEGNTDLRSPTYVYEWIVTPRGATWKITPREITPIIYTKAAIGFHALYNTEYTRSLVNYVVSKNNEVRNFLPYALFLPPKGFIEGVDESGRMVGELIDKTQTLIISAAYYSLKKIALDSGEIVLESLLHNYAPGEKVRINITYSDKSNLRHTCMWAFSIKDAKGISYLDGQYGPTCSLNIEWIPEKPGRYTVEARVLADYVLFNNSLSRNFNITISGSTGIEKEIRIVKILYPDRVTVNKEFNITVGIEYEVQGEETLIILIAEDPSRNFLVKSDPVTVVNNGSLEFMLRLQAPKDEGLMTLKLYVSYTIGEDWVDDPTVMEIAIDVLREVTHRVKELVYITKTSVVTNTQTVTFTYTSFVTVSNSWREAESIKTAFVIAASMMFLALVVAFVLRGSRRASSRVRRWFMKLKPCLIIAIVVTILLPLLLYFLLFNLVYYTNPTTLHMEYSYLPQGTPTAPITLDPYFEYGLRYWGISTSNNGSQPVYTDMCWITHSKDALGFFVYSSILQGCKPYNWGCGNYAFEPIPATEKLYLTISVVKATAAVDRKEGFAGALVDLWFENFKGDALVIDLYLARDILDEHGLHSSVGKGFTYTLTSKNQFGKSYHFNYVLTEARDGERIIFNKLLLEPLVDMVFKTLRLDRSEWWLVSVDAGAEAHYSEVTVQVCMLEVGRIAEQ